MFLTCGWIQAEVIPVITEFQLKEYIKYRANRKPRDHELGRAETVVYSVKMDPGIPVLEYRVFQLVQKYLKVVESAGMASIQEENPHISIKHIMKRLKPTHLYIFMQYIVEW